MVGWYILLIVLILFTCFFIGSAIVGIIREQRKNRYDRDYFLYSLCLFLGLCLLFPVILVTLEISNRNQIVRDLKIAGYQIDKVLSTSRVRIKKDSKIYSCEIHSYRDRYGITKASDCTFMKKAEPVKFIDAKHLEVGG